MRKKFAPGESAEAARRRNTLRGDGVNALMLALTLLACDGSVDRERDAGGLDDGAADSGTPDEGSDGGSPDEARDQVRQLVLAKLRECGVLSRDGTYSGGSDIYYDSGCFGRCLISERCADVKASWCGEAMQTQSLMRCTASCGDERILCQASLRTVPRCDDHVDCPDGSDEASCEYFVCESGQRINYNARCNGQPECADQSDELDCSVECGDGSRPPEATECDGIANCADGSDERDCVARGLSFACSDGAGIVLKSAVCDGRPDCSDGSDEMQGCAKNLCEAP